MLRSIAGSVALVTGASRGIGRAIAEMLAEEGCDLSLIARGAQGLAQTADLCMRRKVRVLTNILDVTDSKELSDAVQRTVAELGGIQILVNNAGTGHLKSALEASAEEWRSTMDTNLLAAMEATRLSLPHMKRQGGTLIFIASISAKITYAEGSAYCASKHGLLGFAGCVFEDVRQFNIKVCSICPGYVNTEMISGLGLRTEGMIQPEDVAEAVRMAVKFPLNCCPTEIVLRSQKAEA